MNVIISICLAFIVFSALYSKQNTTNKGNNTTNISKVKKDSYYTKDKVQSYQKMNQMHEKHNPAPPIDDLCKTIGYKKCPECGTSNSLKSKCCFMCDYGFEKTK